jgi:hypothetical protein
MELTFYNVLGLIFIVFLWCFIVFLWCFFGAILYTCENFSVKRFCAGMGLTLFFSALSAGILSMIIPVYMLLDFLFSH